MEAFYKLVYDISCYYAFAAFFLSYGLEYDVPAYSFLVFFAACYLAVHAEKCKSFGQAVQILAFALPAIPFFLESNTWGKIVVLLPWVYLIVTVLRRGYYMQYCRFTKIYFVIFWIYAAVFLFFSMEDWGKGEVAMMVTGPFLVILLASGTFLMQMLRFHAGSGDKKKLEKYQRWQLVIFMMAAILLTTVNVVELLFTHVFYPLTKLVLGGAMALIVYIVSKLDRPSEVVKELGENRRTHDEFAEQLREAYEKVDSVYKPLRERMQELNRNFKEPDWTPVLIGFAVLAAIVIFAVLFGERRKKSKPVAIEDEREDCFEEVTLKEVLKKRFVRPELIIRYYYREFMKKSEAKKHSLKLSDTTTEILSKYQEWHEVTPEQTEEAKEATVLYQKTRYSKEKMTQTDARRMKALVKEL